MGDKIIITEDEDKPRPPEVVVVKPEPREKVDRVVTEKTTIVEKKSED